MPAFASPLWIEVNVANELEFTNAFLYEAFQCVSQADL